MLNDTISITFFPPQNELGVFIRPILVAEIASSLEGALTALCRSYDSTLVCELLLTGAQAGSLRLSFKTLLKKVGGAEKISQDLDTVDKAWDILKKVGKDLGLLAVTLGVWHQSQNPKSAGISVNIPQRVLMNREATENLTRLTSSIVNSGAGKVTISVPDEPEMTITTEAQSPIQLIGCQPMASMPRTVRATRKFRIVGPEIILEGPSGERKTLYAGNVAEEGDSVIQAKYFAIDWVANEPLIFERHTVKSSGSGFSEGLVSVIGVDSLEGWRLVEGDIKRFTKVVGIAKVMSVTNKSVR